MCFKQIFVLVIFCARGNFAITLTNFQNDTAGMLWDISSYAVLSRQNIGSKLNPQYYKYYYPNRIPSTYGAYPTYAKPYPYKQIPANYYNHYKPRPPSVPYDNFYQQYPQSPYSSYPNNRPQRESVMDILYSIATNDDLQCVPKILCEVTSGTMGGQRSPVGLPLNVNLDSLIGLLSSWNGLQNSPLLHFGKAALLGYTSKGNTRSCGVAYPDCPSDTDRLVQYLNNHNGGFFRYFNGVHPANYQGYAPQYQQNFHQLQNLNNLQNIYNPQNYRPYYQRRPQAERRIQNKPERYIPLNYIEDGKKISFPSEKYINNDYYDSNRKVKGLTFPTNEDLNSYYDQTVTNFLKFPGNEPGDTFRKPKRFFNYHPHSQQTEVLDFQKPLPNHKATQTIFPVRTGTGELKLDPEEFYNRPSYQNENIIFDDQYQNSGGYSGYSKRNEYSNMNDYSKTSFNFPG